MKFDRQSIETRKQAHLHMLNSAATIVPGPEYDFIPETIGQGFIHTTIKTLVNKYTAHMTPDDLDYPDEWYPKFKILKGGLK